MTTKVYPKHRLVHYMVQRPGGLKAPRRTPELSQPDLSNDTQGTKTQGLAKVPTSPRHFQTPCRRPGQSWGHQCLFRQLSGEAGGDEQLSLTADAADAAPPAGGAAGVTPVPGCEGASESRP